MKNLKEKPFSKVINAILITALISIITLLFREELYSDFLNDNIGLIFLFFVVLFLVVYSLELLILFPLKITLSSNKVIKEYHFLFINYKREYFFNKNDLIVLKEENIFHNFFYEGRLKLYSINKIKILSIVLDKDILNDCLSNVLNVTENIKKPYKKNESYYIDNLNILSMITNVFIILFIIYVSLLFVLSFFDGVLFLGSVPLVFLIFFFTYFIIITITFFHSTGVEVRIKEDEILTSKGLFFKEYSFLPTDCLKEIVLYSSPFKNKLNNYTLFIRIGLLRYITIPLHKENFELLTKIKLKDELYKKSPNLELFIISLVFNVLLTVLFIFYNIPTGIFYLIISTTLSFYLFFYTGTYIYDDYLLYYNSIFINRIKLLSKKNISEVKTANRFMFKIIMKDKTRYRIKKKDYELIEL